MKLEELYEEIKEMDPSEPACMDKIKMYYDELEIEDEQYMELLVDKLENHIITWPQPWYQVTKCLSRPIKDPDELHEETYRTDTITKLETELILKNWRKFRKRYDVPDKLICLARWKNKLKTRFLREQHVRHFVISYLARGLERSLYQVLRHITTYFGSPVKGDYSSHEEKLMEICFQHEPRKAAVILSKVLGREPRGIYKRLGYTIEGKPPKKKLKWTLPLATKFLKLLIEYSDCSLEELKYKRFNKSVWLKLEEDIDHQYVYLQRFWYSTLHVQLFVKEYVTMKRLRKKIFKTLQSSHYQVWTDIQWKELLKEFPDGYTHIFLYRIAQRAVRKIPNYLKISLQEVVNHVFNNLKSDRYYLKRLRNVKLNKEGILEPIKYDKVYLAVFLSLYSHL
ncbi:uncharacterized protein ACR2FA_011423 [Aphomia sociella]